jgi:hypothetical protein
MQEGGVSRVFSEISFIKTFAKWMKNEFFLSLNKEIISQNFVFRKTVIFIEQSGMTLNKTVK